MAKKYFKDFFPRQRKPKGFTLIEVLVSVAIGWVVISGILFFIVQLMQTDRREYAVSETQREMSIALDYIAADLKEAIYVYEGDCLGAAARGTSGSSNYCPGLGAWIPFTSNNVTPVLAFWKLEPLPYSSSENLPASCTPGSTSTSSCQDVLLSRSTYTLVVYGLRRRQNETWEGPAQITRFQLRQYSNVASLTPTKGYRDPTQSGFLSWPRDNSGNLSAGIAPPDFNDQVNIPLVDLVDDNGTGNRAWQTCPIDAKYPYSRTPPDTLNPSNKGGFYACVRQPSAGQVQDVIVYLRGNAVKRAGEGFDVNNAGFLPKVQVQVQTRSVFQRKPVLLPNN